MTPRTLYPRAPWMAQIEADIRPADRALDTVSEISGGRLLAIPIYPARFEPDAIHQQYPVLAFKFSRDGQITSVLVRDAHTLAVDPAQSNPRRRRDDITDDDDGA